MRSGGTLQVTGPAIFAGNNALKGGSMNGGIGGYAAGTDLFMMTGSTVTLDPGAGNTISFEGSIADDSAATLSIFSHASGSGASLTINSGLVIFNSMNTYSGTTLISGGVLQAASNVNANSNIHLAGGIFEGQGTLFRFLGTQSNRLQFSSGGFSSAGGDFTVTLNAGATLIWGITSYFLPSGEPFRFGSSSATNNVIFTNPLNLNGVNQTILATANANHSNTAILSGVLSNGSLTVGDLTHTGTVTLSGASTYAGPTQVNEGSLVLTGSLASTISPLAGVRRYKI